MKISNDIRAAINLCLRHGLSFVAYAMPCERRLTFRSSLGETDTIDTDYFFVNNFAEPLANIVKIPFVADELLTVEALEERPTDICKSPAPELPANTTYADYVTMVDKVIADLQENGGKAVISRTVCDDVRGVDWIEFAREYFAKLPLAYRFIYYTPTTGAWIVATPELLFSYDSTTSTAHTMALAGTRKCAGNHPWDSKNIAEQAIVSDFITEVLSALGPAPRVTGPRTSTFGEIEHLCSSFDIFNVKLSEEEVFKYIDALNPTPAVAGYPRDKALEIIKSNELHKRACYSGYIGLKTDESITAVVNLRCLTFKGSHYCIYAGGGIMPQSIADNEWKETEAKSACARSIIKKLTSER